MCVLYSTSASSSSRAYGIHYPAKCVREGPHLHGHIAPDEGIGIHSHFEKIRGWSLAIKVRQVGPERSGRKIRRLVCHASCGATSELDLTEAVPNVP